jgi:hypothetical protein
MEHTSSTLSESEVFHTHLPCVHGSNGSKMAQALEMSFTVNGQSLNGALALIWLTSFLKAASLGCPALACAYVAIIAFFTFSVVYPLYL